MMWMRSVVRMLMKLDNRREVAWLDICTFVLIKNKKKRGRRDNGGGDV